MSAEILLSDSPDPSPAAGDSPFAVRGGYERIVPWQRALLFFTGLILVSLLTTAALLNPDPHGLGTHQQLGLPPCSAIMLFGVRCPACGMTTSWSHLMHGQLLRAAHANAGGLLLGLFSLAIGPWMLTSAALGRWWLGAIHPAWLAAASGLIFTVTTAQWIWRVLL